VRDQDRSLDFYLDRLGFTLVADLEYEGFRWVAVAPPDGQAVIALLTPDPGSEGDPLIGRSAGVVFVTDDLAAKFSAWSARGVRFRKPPEVEPWGGTIATFEDIDGNAFALVSVDAISRELEAQRRRTAEKAESERRIAYELDIARQVQARLFPQTQPSIRTLDYAGICIQARQVGGDYYDFLNLGGDRFGLVIGDISGKGIAAALLMANLQANLRGQCAVASEPQALLRSVNEIFCRNTPEDTYATLFFAEYDDRTRRLRYANCGHLPALLLRRDNGVEKLDSTCTVVGLFEEWKCIISECELFAGDTLAIYTDGITDSFNDVGEEFGEERLTQALRQYRQLPSHAMLASIVDDVRRFSAPEQFDDITLTVGTCREA
jgi:serine phosphatase RsbU (regulator of sigma subunit)/predicted enzyme related to lactoylglutathione lyase